MGTSAVDDRFILLIFLPEAALAAGVSTVSDVSEAIAVTFATRASAS